MRGHWVALDPEQNWSLDLDQVAKKMRPNTRVISVNFPNNSTGKILGADEFTQLVQLCDERGIYLFSDEVYRGLDAIRRPCCRRLQISTQMRCP